MGAGSPPEQRSQEAGGQRSGSSENMASPVQSQEGCAFWVKLSDLPHLGWVCEGGSVGVGVCACVHASVRRCVSVNVGVRHGSPELGALNQT